MNVEYPENWENNYFVKMAIIFNGFHALEVNEMPFWGEPTILSAESTEENNGYFKVKMETNAGYRQVTAKTVSLVKEWQYA